MTSSSLLANNLKIGLQDDDLQIGLSKDGGTTVDFFDEGFDQDQLAEYTSYSPAAPLDAVSGMYQNLWYDQTVDASLQTPSFREAFDLSDNVTTSNKSSGGYIQFTAYFTAKSRMYIFLDSTTTLTASANNKTIAERLGVSQEELDKVQDCLRISFFSEYSDQARYTIYEPNVAASSETAYAGRLNVKGDDDYYDYSFDSASGVNKETLYGEYSGSNVVYSSDAAVSDYQENGALSAFNSNTFESQGAFDRDKSVAAGLEIAKEQSYTLEELTYAQAKGSANRPVVYLPGYDAGSPSDEGCTKAVTISIWLEGWDLDMTDVVSSAQFDLNLVFSGILMPEGQGGF